MEDLWASGLLVFHKVGREILCNLALHFIQFLLPPILHLSPSPVGIGSSQDQVTWLKWNGISFSIILPLLSPCLCHGLHLSLFKVFHTAWQCSGQHIGISVYPGLWGNRSWWVNVASTWTLDTVGCIQWWSISYNSRHAPTWADALASLLSSLCSISLSCASAFCELILPAHWFEHGKVKS